MNPRPSLEQLRTARDSARQRRDSAAKRLKRIILKLVTRVEAYEHELSLLSKVERGLVVNGKADWELPAIFTTAPQATETRFNGGGLNSAVITAENDPGTSSAIRGASRGPLADSPIPKAEPVLPVASQGGPQPANLPAAGDIF